MKYAKSLLTIAGAVPPAAVFTWLDSIGVHTLPGWAQLAITIVCSLAAVLFGPANQSKTLEEAVDELPEGIASLWSQHAQTMDPATGVTPTPEPPAPAPAQ